jgi:hypothetical protein
VGIWLGQQCMARSHCSAARVNHEYKYAGCRRLGQDHGAIIRVPRSLGMQSRASFKDEAQSRFADCNERAAEPFYLFFSIE